MNIAESPILFTLLLLGLPAVIAGLALLAGHKLAGPTRAGWMGGLGFAVAYSVGHALALERWPGWPPTQAGESLCYAGAFAGLTAAAVASSRLSSWIASLVLGLSHVATMAWVLRRVLERQGSSQQLLAAVIAFALAALVTLRFERIVVSSKSWFSAFLVWVVAASAAVSIVLTGSVLYAQCAAVVAAILGAAVVFAWIRRDTELGRALPAAAYLQLLALGFAAKELSGLPTVSLACLALAPWSAVTLTQSFERRWSDRKLAVARLAVTLAACAVAIGFAWAAHLESASSASYY